MYRLRFVSQPCRWYLARVRRVHRLHQVLSDLRITPNSSIDPTTVARIAEFSDADTVIWGQYARFGELIRIDATLRDLKHQRTIPANAKAGSA